MYSCLSCLTAAKCLLGIQWFQRKKNAPCGPALSGKLAIIYYKFWFLPGYQLDKTDVCFCHPKPACGGQWLKSIVLFLYHSYGTSIVVLVNMHYWADILYISFFVTNNSCELWHVTVMLDPVLLVHLKIIWTRSKWTLVLLWWSSDNKLVLLIIMQWDMWADEYP